MTEAARQSRSPSPAPAPPIASTPGPRAQALLNVFQNALDATLNKVNGANFADCFPTPARYVPEVLDDIHGQFVGQLGGAWKKNFDEICVKRNVVKGLNELDMMITDAKKRKVKAVDESKERGEESVQVPVPMHTLSPNTLYQSHLHPFLASHASTLNTDLATLQSANRTLYQEIVAQRQEMDSLIKGLEAIVEDLEKSAQMLESDEVQGLRQETRDVDAVMNSGS